MTSPVFGKLPGFDYSIGATEGSPCLLCGRDDVPVLRSKAKLGICEPCTLLSNWAWQNATGYVLPGYVFPQSPQAVLVMIVKDRPRLKDTNIEDLSAPYQFLMVGRKDDPGNFGLPGGKVEKGETCEEAAVRELREETGIETWPSALEVLYSGYTPRGRLLRAYLCRGYHGEPSSPEGMPVLWKPDPIIQQTGLFSGFYIGVSEAFKARETLNRKTQSVAPLSLHMKGPAIRFLELKLAQITRGVQPDDARELDGNASVLTTEEKHIIEIITATKIKIRDAKAVALLPKMPIPPRPTRPPVVQGEMASGEDGGEEGEEGGVPASEEDRALGFVRGAAPAMGEEDGDDGS